MQHAEYALPFHVVVHFNEHLLKARSTLLDAGKLESALARPLHAPFGEPLFPTVYQRAAALLEGVASAHAFIDGNKRTALVCALAYLDANSIKIRRLPPEVGGQMVIDLVTHTLTLEDVAMWFLNQVENPPF